MASRKLVIIESPAKAKSLRSYLGSGYEVVASMGHVRDLPKNRIGVSSDGSYKPLYTILQDRRKAMESLRKTASGFETIFLAADPDREGEAICWHLSELLAREGVTFRRLRFNAVTRDAVLSAVAHPSSIDMDLVDAQQARRVMDRLVGYRISPYLWRAISPGLSAGRVQSVALRLIQEREDEIGSFVPVEYWTSAARFRAGVEFEAELTRIDGVKTGPEKNAPGSGPEMELVLSRARAASWEVLQPRVSRAIRKPGPPYITSSLQQAASTQLSFSPSRTMSIAQELYEGVDLGGGEHAGLITYMRTDSVRIEPEALASCREFIRAGYGEGMLPEAPRRYRSSGGSQDAHEAIRPTDVSRRPADLSGILSEPQLKLYALIWRRFVASQCADSAWERTEVAVEGGGLQYSRTGEVVISKGFLEIDPSQASSEPPVPAGIVPGGASLLEVSSTQHFTKPPPRFTEAGLVAWMKKNGIGRPSTYVGILDTLKKRGYTTVTERKLVPTELGTATVRLLVQIFPHIFETGFTASMEEVLDDVAAGRTSYRDAMEKLDLPLRASLEQAITALPEVRKDLSKETSEICPECGSPLLLRLGRYGRFLSCSAFPKCRFTRAEGETAIAPGRDCPLCGAPMVQRNGRFGQYLACSKAPGCRHTEAMPTGVPCPVESCGGELVQKRSKRGKTFYSCSRYPECDFAMWNKPVEATCPKCGFPVMEEGKKGLQCPRCKRKTD